MKKRTFSREMKLEAVRLYRTSGKTAAQIAHELGIHPTLLFEWRRKFQHELDAPEPPSPDLEKELKRLQRENARLREEREILKKAYLVY